ncbi:MAG: T9SS type A sorting domain-containing protein [Bacteroidota bacterium]
MNGVQVTLLHPAISDSTNYLGIYKTGVLNTGLYDVQFTHLGYYTKVIHNVQLDSAITVTLDVELVPSTPFNITMTVLDSSTGNPIPNAKVFIDDNIQYSGAYIADFNGVVSFNQIYTSSYSIYAGSWGHKTRMISGQQLNPNTTGLSIAIPKGYYDDFFFDFAWTVTGNASTGIWERGVPVGTTNGNSPSNAGADVANDFGLTCFVTGNSGGNAADDDVDNGSSILTSPVFDLSSSYDPRINCYTWFYDGGNGAPNDSLSLFISNGDSTKLVAFSFADTSQMSQWLLHDFRIKDFVEPSANMHFIVRTADQSASGNICEGGLDLFTVVDTATFNSVSELQIADYTLQVYPNPVSSQLTVDSKQPAGNAVTICDLAGRVLLHQNISGNEMKIDVSYLAEGIYLLRVGNVVKEFCVAR